MTATTSEPPGSAATTGRPARGAPRQTVAMVLVVAEILLAAGAFAGAVGLVTGGVDLGAAADDLPFASPVLGGVALAVACGLLPTVVVVGAQHRARWAPWGHVAVGVALVGWIVVQVGFIGLGSWLQVTYGLFGLAITALAVTNLSARAPVGGMDRLDGGPGG